MRIKPCKNNPLPARITMSGFSLVEIMVALGISLFILAGIGYVYISSKQTYRTQEQLARLQENGRLAFEYLARDIRMAGYWGCGTAGMDSDNQFIPPTSGKCTIPKARIANTLKNASTTPFNFGRYIEGFDDVNSSFATYPNVKVGTDVFVTRGADPLGLRVTKHPGVEASPGSADIKVSDASGIKAGDILMVTDCTSAAVFQAEKVNNNTNVVHNAPNSSDSPGNSTKLFCKNYEGGEVLKAFSRGYYIGTLDNAGQPTSTGRPALFRAEFNLSYAELVPSIENMQITYGVDTNNDYFADIYKTAAEITASSQWAQVKSLRIELLLVSTEDNITAGNVKYRFPTSAASDTTAPDRRLYYITSTTISIRNRTQ